MKIGDYSLRRQPKPRSRWADPHRPEYYPAWTVRLQLPARPRRDVSSKVPICELCLAVPQKMNPAKERPRCRCQGPARKWADERLRAEGRLWREGRVDALRGLGERSTSPSIGALFDAYEGGMPARMQAGARRNMAALAAIVEQTTGKAARPQSVDVLTKRLALDWMQIRQAARDLPGRTDRELRAMLAAGDLQALQTDVPLAGNATINSMLTKARAVVGRKARTYYLGDLGDRLPPLTGFLQLSRLPAKVGHQALPEETAAALVALGERWKKSEPEKWLAFAMMAGMGLRPSEALAARGHWLEEIDGQPVLVVKNRPEDGFWLKARAKARARRYAVPPAMQALVRGREGFLVAPGLSKTGRSNLVYRTMSGEIRKVVGDDVKDTNYLLRKAAGSAEYTEKGKEAAAARLGHASSDTTERHYADYDAVLPCLVG